jgi:hypothetical protein
MEWGTVEAEDVGPRSGGRDLGGPGDLAGLFAGSDLDDEDEGSAFGVLQARFGWVGSSGPGVALRLRIHAHPTPDTTGVELRLRDDARYVRSPLRPFQDRHGDLTLALPVPPEGEDGRILYAHLPYAALPRRVGDALALEAWLVEDTEPVEETLFAVELPAPDVRRIDNALAAVAFAMVSAEGAGHARAHGPALVADRIGRMEASLARLFRLDAIGRGVAAALLADAEAEADRMAAARLRAHIAPDGIPAILAALEQLAGAPPAQAELAWIAALAARLGTTTDGARPGATRGRRGGPSPAAVAHLATLGLGPCATWDEVRAAWRRAAATDHPDRAPADAQAAAHERMKALNAAYAALRRSMGRGR